MNWQGHGHLDTFGARYWQQPGKGGSILFMTVVTVFYVTVRRIVTGHTFYVCWKIIEWVCRHLFRYKSMATVVPTLADPFAHLGEKHNAKNLMPVYTLKQSSGGTSRGFTNIKLNRSMFRSDWKCSPVYRYWLNQSKWTFSTEISKGTRYVFPKVCEWVTKRDTCRGGCAGIKTAILPP